jgi:hypothetical protein
MSKQRRNQIVLMLKLLPTPQTTVMASGSRWGARSNLGRHCGGHQRRRKGPPLVFAHQTITSPTKPRASHARRGASVGVNRRDRLGVKPVSMLHFGERSARVHQHRSDLGSMGWLRLPSVRNPGERGGPVRNDPPLLLPLPSGGLADPPKPTRKVLARASRGDRETCPVNTHDVSIRTVCSPSNFAFPVIIPPA